MDANEFPKIPMTEQDREKFPRHIFAWMGHQDNGSWDKEPCPCCPSVKYIRCDQKIPNVTVLMFIMGFQGGTVHQCAKHLGLSVPEIINATPEMMENFMRLAQKIRNERNVSPAARNAVDLLEDNYSMEIAEPECWEAIREALGMPAKRGEKL